MRWKTAAMKGRLLLLESELRKEDEAQDDEEDEEDYEEDENDSVHSPEVLKRRRPSVHPAMLGKQAKIQALTPDGPFRCISFHHPVESYVSAVPAKVVAGACPLVPDLSSRSGHYECNRCQQDCRYGVKE
jgi:hypothetical protein